MVRRPCHNRRSGDHPTTGQPRVHDFPEDRQTGPLADFSQPPGPPMSRSSLHLSRRDWLRLSAAGVAGSSLSGWLGRLAAVAAGDARRRRSCILLWMGGGPSQTDTFDLKPGHANGGPFKEIQTSAPGVNISEHLPGVAKHADRMAIIRSMSTKEGDHSLATYHLHTGYAPRGPIRYPSFGSLVAKE